MTSRQVIFRACSVTVVFVCLICFPFINQTLGIVKDQESFENRAMAPKPEFNPALLDPFPAKYEAYYNDNFTLRSRMIKTFSLYNMLALKKSPVPDKVIIGSHGWLFSAGTEQDAYLGKNRFTDAELNIFKQELEYRQSYLAARHCKFIVIIAPVKGIIYPENMPYEQHRLNPQSPGEQLIDFLNTHSSIKTVDLYAEFFKSKKNYDMYRALDNHWNNAGAFYASNEIIRCLQRDFPVLKPLPLSDYTIKESPMNSGNIALQLGNLNIFSDHEYEIIPKGGFRAKHVDAVGYKVPDGFPYPWEYETDSEIKDTTLPKALIVSDSFGGQLFPFLAENFSRCVKLFDAWQYKLNGDVVNAEKPDVYILLMHEAILHNFFDHQSRLSAAAPTNPNK